MAEEIVPTTSKIERRRQIRKMADTGPTIKEYADAMIELKGNVSKVAQKLNLPPEVVRRKIKFTPELIRIKNNIREEKLDIAEDKLAEQVESGNVTAITYTLNNLGKERGFGKGEDQEVNVNVFHSAGLIDRLKQKSELPDNWSEDQITELQDWEWIEESEDA